VKLRVSATLVIVFTMLLPLCCGTSEAASALAVHVQNNHLVDANGNLLRLYGVNRSGSEYACQQGWGIFDGPSDDASIAAIKAWHVNAVRVPLNEDCWLGINLPPKSVRRSGLP
jgi:endoglucanase